MSNDSAGNPMTDDDARQATIPDTDWAPYMHWAKTHHRPRWDLSGSNLLPCTINELPGAAVPALAAPAFVKPEFSLAAMVELVIPLAIFFFSQRIFLSGIVVSGAEK